MIAVKCGGHCARFGLACVQEEVERVGDEFGVGVFHDEDQAALALPVRPARERGGGVQHMLDAMHDQRLIAPFHVDYALQWRRVGRPVVSSITRLKRGSLPSWRRQYSVRKAPDSAPRTVQHTQPPSSATVSLLPHLCTNSHPLAAFGIGMLFALVFDTASQIAAWGYAGNMQHGPTAALLLGLAFTAGMIVVDAFDGYLMSRLLANPDLRQRERYRRMVGWCGHHVSSRGAGRPVLSRAQQRAQVGRARRQQQDDRQPAEQGCPGFGQPKLGAQGPHGDGRHGHRGPRRAPFPSIKVLIDGIPSNVNRGNQRFIDMIFPLEVDYIEVVRGTNDPRDGIRRARLPDNRPGEVRSVVRQFFLARGEFTGVVLARTGAFSLPVTQREVVARWQSPQAALACGFALWFYCAPSSSTGVYMMPRRSGLEKLVTMVTVSPGASVVLGTTNVGDPPCTPVALASVTPAVR